MSGDIRFQDDRVLIDGKAHFACDTQEVECSGPLAGFAFHDRQQGASPDTQGTRWVWYCDQKVARLWAGADLLTIQIDGRFPTLQVGPVDVTGTLQELRQAVSTLQAEVDELRAKLGMPPGSLTPQNGRPAPSGHSAFTGGGSTTSGGNTSNPAPIGQPVNTGGGAPPNLRK